MALSNAAASTVQPESGGGVQMRVGSPVSSSVGGFTTHTSVAQDVRPGATTQRSPLNLELPQFPQASVHEGAKEATTHDFLSLYKNTAPAGKTETASARGMMPSIATQDFLQPLEKCGKPVSGNLLPPGLMTATGPMNRLRVSNTNSYGGVQESGYGLLNGTMELTPNVSVRTEGVEGGLNGVKERLENLAHWSNVQLKFGSSELGYAPKAMPTYSHLEAGQQHASILSKQWQQTGSEFYDMAKRPPRVPSEDDEDEDEEYLERSSRDQRKDGSFQKGDVSQKLDGKNNDCKGSTPRSKHSATEQRRRSKINDRFQMLRQLVPNNDQKRDKASFLLEVIEYIQFLQEKVRKSEATEHGRQQERMKNITWDISQRNTGVRDSVVDAPRMDSLVYGKEHIPIVSTVAFDMKQAADNNGLVRPRLTSAVSPPEHEVSSIGHVPLPVDRPAQASQGRHTSFENKAVITKPIPVTLSAQSPVHAPFGRGSSHVTHSNPHSGSESQPLSSRPLLYDEQVMLPVPNSKALSYNKVEAALPQLHGNSQPPAQSISNVDEHRQQELKGKQHEPSQQDANNEKCSEDLANSEPNLVPELQPSVAGSSSRQLRNGDAVVSRLSSGMKNAVALKPESQQKGEVYADGHEPMTIQGGVINVSSVYSQGLLDTLTRALQSSGLDLSQASISVQINLGKAGGAAVAANSTKAATQSTETPQQSQGHGKQAASSQELEHPNKKPKIEVES